MITQSAKFRMFEFIRRPLIAAKPTSLEVGGRKKSPVCQRQKRVHHPR
jgi:hypothetical protein